MQVKFIGGPQDGLVQVYNAKSLLGIKELSIERDPTICSMDAELGEGIIVPLSTAVYSLRPTAKPNLLVARISHYEKEET